MDSTELRDVFRSEMFDLAEPYLVSDFLVYTYLDDAQKMFCRLTEGIEDGRKFTIAVQAGVEWYILNKSILKIRRVADLTTGRPVDLISAETADQRGVTFDGRVGPLRAVVTGSQKGQVRVWPVPALSSTLTLEVFRLSAKVEEGDGFEIDEQHHLALVLWAKHKAYGIHDSELFDADKSAMYEARFRAYCAAARVEQNRARHSAGNVMYGGV
jgi:hypothetical protein